MWPTSISTRASTRCAPTPPSTTTAPSARRARTRPTARASSSPRARASWCSRRAQHAEARGAAILGVLLGYGMSSDGTGNMVAPSPEGAELAMRRALGHARLAPDALDYVNTHATSTPLGDVSEVRALRTVLGGRHVAYSSTKGYTGHPVSGAGAIEAIFTLAMLRGGWIAPVRQRGAARPGAPRLPAGRAARVAAAAHGAQQLVRLRRHERRARARPALRRRLRALTAPGAGCQTPHRNVRVPPVSGG